jgi:hypothetical protein
MPICPDCHDEFQGWVKVCPDCGVDLVEQLPPRQVVSRLPYERLVTVADYSYSTLAYLSQAKLESEGISSFIFDEYIINANWLYLIAIGGVKLKVRESNAAEAIQILEEIRDTIPGPAEQPEDGCPRCRSSFIHYETFHIRRSYIVMAISSLLGTGEFLLLFSFFKRRWKCNSCNYEWKNENRPSSPD